MIEVAFSFKSQETEKIELFSQGTDESINLRYESLITIDYKYKYKFQFCSLEYKVKAVIRWLSNSDIH